MISMDNDISSFYPHSMTIPKIKPFKKVDEAMVDGELWHSIHTRCNSEVANWLREQEDLAETGTGWGIFSYFDVPDKIYMMLLLRFQ